MNWRKMDINKNDLTSFCHETRTFKTTNFGKLIEHNAPNFLTLEKTNLKFLIFSTCTSDLFDYN